MHGYEVVGIGGAKVGNRPREAQNRGFPPYLGSGAKSERTLRHTQTTPQSESLSTNWFHIMRMYILP